MSAYIVGIDLGTTNCTVSFTAAEAQSAEVETFNIPQLTAPGRVEARNSLPSFLYLPAEGEFSGDSLMLPWGGQSDWIVGTFARDHGASSPARQVASAKSWLCHGGINREAAILPQGHSLPQGLSPVDAAERLLAHIRDAWNFAHPQAPLEEQSLVVTVPASFDPVARELTGRAIRRVGFQRVTLLEEPQAALYAWLYSAGEGWREHVQPGDEILVCDVGGGTSDFSLIQVRDVDGQVGLERVAVGEHILLGGDNMDIALAHVAGRRLSESGEPVDPWQQRELWHRCRMAKESLLSDPNLGSVQVSILGRGSGLVGGTRTTEINRGDIAAIVFKGFFPSCEWGTPVNRPPQRGLRQQGLPYAKDPAITRHLSEFLVRSEREGRRGPDHILFNGGVFEASALQSRVGHVLGQWRQQLGEPDVLQGKGLDVGVSVGAAYYGMVRNGKGIRIKGGTAATYYIGVESAAPAIPGFDVPMDALCVAPFGMEEGSRIEVQGEEFSLVLGEPVVFSLLHSNSYSDDDVGMIRDGQSAGLTELPSLEATLPSEEGQAGQFVPVTLETRFTELGTLEIWCTESGGERAWKLEVDLRAGQEEGEHGP